MITLIFNTAKPCFKDNRLIRTPSSIVGWIWITKRIFSSRWMWCFPDIVSRWAQLVSFVCKSIFLDLFWGQNKAK